MNAVDLAVAQLKMAEGFRHVLYRDTTGHLTIGYGFNVDAGLSEPSAAALLTSQVIEIEETLAPMPWAQGLDDARFSAIINMGFNVGIHGLLAFVQMLSAVQSKNWDAAHDACLDSLAARQAPNRYKVIAQILLTGELP